MTIVQTLEHERRVAIERGDLRTAHLIAQRIEEEVDEL